MAWSKGLAQWIEGDTAFISVVFSWKLPEAYQLALFYRAQGYRVRAGGPAIFAMPKYLNDVADLNGTVEALVHHNPLATMASRGCPGMGTEDQPKPCSFCIVPKMEGTRFTLIPDFVPRPILVDNNLSALPVTYQNHIIEKYKKSGVRLQDCNSGFEPVTFDTGTYQRWSEIYKGAWRFGYDTLKERDNVYRMFQILKDIPSSRKRIYVLIGNEPRECCMQRIHEVIEWGGEPYCQPMMDLNALVRRPRARYDWTENELMNVARWANRWIWRSVPFSQYKSSFRGSSV